jgi:hypothetical protein
LGDTNDLIELALPVPELRTEKVLPIGEPRVRRGVPTEFLKGLGSEIGLSVSCGQIVHIGRATVRRGKGPEKTGHNSPG